MADFLTRIELHGANAADYEQLHTAMEKAGFSRTVQGFHLPTAEYWLASNLTSDQVREKAKDIATGIRSNPSVLVAEVANWSAWLTPVRKAG